MPHKTKHKVNHQPKNKDKSQTKLKPKENMSKDYERAVKTMAKGAGIGFVGFIIGKVLAFLIRIFIAQTRGPQVYGLISIGIAILDVLLVFSIVGMDSGLPRFISFYRGKKKLGQVKGAITSSFKISIPLSIIFSIFLFIFSSNLAEFFSKPELIYVIRIFSIALPFSVSIVLLYSIFLGFKLIKEKVYTLEIGKNLSTFLFLLLFSFISSNILGISIAFLLGFIFSFLVGIFYLKNSVLYQLKKVKVVSVSKELLSFSWPLLLVSMLSLIMSWTDVIMLGYFDTARNVGIYSAALNLCILLGIFSSGIGYIFTPIISELYSKNKMNDIRKIYNLSTSWMFCLTLPLFLILILFPDNVLSLFYGKEFVYGSSALIVLSIGFFLSVSVGLAPNTILSMGKPKVNMYLTFLAAICNFSLNLFLIPLYGIIGAAIAMTISLSLLAFSSIFYLYRKIGIHPCKKNYIKSSIASFLSISVIYFFIKGIFKLESIYIMFCGFVVFLTLYAGLLLILRSFNEEDVLILKAIEKKYSINISWMKKLIKKFI